MSQFQLAAVAIGALAVYAVADRLPNRLTDGVDFSGDPTPAPGASDIPITPDPQTPTTPAPDESDGSNVEPNTIATGKALSNETDAQGGYREVALPTEKTSDKGEPLYRRPEVDETTWKSGRGAGGTSEAAQFSRF